MSMDVSAALKSSYEFINLFSNFKKMSSLPLVKMGCEIFFRFFFFLFLIPETVEGGYLTHRGPCVAHRILILLLILWQPQTATWGQVTKLAHLLNIHYLSITFISCYWAEHSFSCQNNCPHLRHEKASGNVLFPGSQGTTLHFPCPAITE